MIADVHMSNRLSYAQPLGSKNGVTDRLRDQIELWTHVHEVASENKVDAIMVLGDLFDRSLVDAVTLTSTTRAIMKSPVPIYLLPGNHDANSVKGGRYTVEAFGQMGTTWNGDLVTVIDERSTRSDLQFKLPKTILEFWPVGFKPLAETREALEDIRKQLDPERINVLLLHNSVLGAEHLGWRCDDGLDPKEVCEGFDQVLAGHFHLGQTFGTCGRYLGAPMQYNFGDAENSCGFWLFQWSSKKKNSVEFIESNAPKFHTFERLMTTSEMKKIPAGDYIRFEIAATHPSWVKQKPAFQTLCDALVKQGYHASYKHKPIAQHVARMGEKNVKKAVSMSMEQAVSNYTKAVGVVTTGLDLARLKTMGREILDTARQEHENS